jgi:PHP family Zn ribbon phosphoesterase
LPLDTLPNYSGDFVNDKNKTKSILWDVKESNIDNVLKTILSTKEITLISIQTDFYRGNCQLLFNSLLKIDKNKMAAIRLVLPEYELKESDVQWLLSLPNLQKLSIQVKKIPTSFLKGLKKLNKLRVFHCTLDKTEETSRLFLESISAHPSIEYLSIFDVVFSDTYNLTLPPQTSIVEIGLSSLTSKSIKDIGQSTQVRHLAILGSKFPNCEYDASQYFHSKLRCLEIENKEFSKCIMDSLEYFTELRMLFVQMTDNNSWRCIENKIASTKNILRVLVVDNEIKNESSDIILKRLRSKYAIYADYYANWMQCVSRYTENYYNKIHFRTPNTSVYIRTEGLYEIYEKKKHK